MRLSDEKGVALLTVLLLVAVMSVLAVTVLDEIRFAVRRTTNAEAVGQARWYALGAETLARARIPRLMSAGASLPGWSGRAAGFPVDGGRIQARISDGGNCFNLNSVVAGAGEVLERRDEGVLQFLGLAEALGFAPREAETMAAALVDWIDTDPLRESGGAEDESYDGYRTAAALLAERSELRAIRGFTAEAYARLRPYVCALPTNALSPININTLTEAQAPLVVMLTDGPMSVAAARRLIASRPPAGWSDTAEFVAAVNETPTPLRQEATAQVGREPRFFRLETEVALGDAEVVSSALLQADGGRVRLVARRWGPEE